MFEFCFVIFFFLRELNIGGIKVEWKLRFYLGVSSLYSFVLSFGKVVGEYMVLV